MDMESSDAFNETMKNYIAANKMPFILNCKELEYINSTGLASFIHVSQKLDKLNQNFLLCELQGPVKEIINLSELDTYLKIFADEKEALANL